jgi:integrase
LFEPGPMTNSNLILLQGRTFDNFINAIKSAKTKAAYTNSLKRYLNYHRLTEVDDLLLHSTNPKLIESQIIDYIMSLRQDGLAYTTIQFLVAPVLTFYSLNDLVLNKRKISRYFGEYKKVVKDRAYTAEEIYKALQTADQRMKVIILLLTSTGQRIGSLEDLTLGNLTKIDNYGLYKIVVYEGTNNEYYNFTTRECAAVIDDYLEYRRRCGERISFNDKTRGWEPSATPLIREQFDSTDVLQARRPQVMVTNSIRKSLAYHLVKCGLRTVEHPSEPNSTKRVRKSVALGNGFRKFTISSFVRAKVNHEIRQFLVDHKGGYLDESYLRLTEEEILSEYLKAEHYLTVSPELRLKQEVQTLKQDKTDYGVIQAKVGILERENLDLQRQIEEDIRKEMIEKMDAINELQQENQDLRGQVGNTNKHLGEILKRIKDLDKRVHKSVDNASSLDEEVKRVRSHLLK